ncbi:helix-hairpin-helix domain-containing protein [Natrinema soli]|uniref:Helix-hairpin-helix domain-containing protein n=1 Tax=Natrinema soli TaxID=1930624 RepID=A0ABD5STG5_9EURY|nr:helix-hairpin-helix domain-containing protein [Natrinema soli]
MPSSLSGHSPTTPTTASPPPEDPVTEAKRLYAEGQIDEPELEPDSARPSTTSSSGFGVVEDVNGVGPVTGKAIAREYDSLDGLRESDRGRLEGVYGVGEETAGAVLERVQ